MQTTETKAVFKRHHGIWDGTYTRMDAKTGAILDHHKSRLYCNMDGDVWRQRNEYTWADGRREVREFPGGFIGNGWLRFDNERLTGQACGVDANTIFLEWTYKGEEGNHYCEFITLISDTHRARVWKHFENGEFTKLTVIDENKVSDNPDF
jgi:hypothetical protein